ncbi:hypothetical protein Sfum_1057 [Syntrophobacter fumaroxidans MPOB]|uniref:Uncharacterized protein n=1 Tax=Syntrophobacter fumaroxidans (strain DSM 10017 / MPOB) TaxID=335543 RepID=A0LH49_SYNFM|nr:hypothetical protein Sfum_1057 [Syntrophobacter fumaroxidans MPOB]
MPVKKIGPFWLQPDPPSIVAAGSGHFGRGRMFLNYNRQMLKDFHREPKIVRGKRRLRKHPQYWRWLTGFRWSRESIRFGQAAHTRAPIFFPQGVKPCPRRPHDAITQPGRDGRQRRTGRPEIEHPAFSTKNLQHRTELCLKKSQR